MHYVASMDVNVVQINHAHVRLGVPVLMLSTSTFQYKGYHISNTTWFIGVWII